MNSNFTLVNIYIYANLYHYVQELIARCGNEIQLEGCLPEKLGCCRHYNQVLQLNS